MHILFVLVYGGSFFVCNLEEEKLITILAVSFNHSNDNSNIHYYLCMPVTILLYKLMKRCYKHFTRILI